jgi:tetratricopeptide (TPR) repeat protein
MVKAIVKLEEALGQLPQEPAVLHELGVVHEQMGVYDKASEYYQKVFELGTSGAGTYYETAAAKLRDGFENPADHIGRLSLGRVRIFQSPDQSNGQTVILTIPIQKAPSFEAQDDLLEVKVNFFNRTTKGDIIQLEDESWVRKQWVSLPFDWSSGEELLRMTYTIPRQDQQTEHLFGIRSYYGQVVSLSYQGEILDVQAWPRDLAARLPGTPASASNNNQLPDFLDLPPPDFDPDLGVLPPLPE